MTREVALVGRHLPGWTVRAYVSSEHTGSLVEVQRFCTDPQRRGLDTRTVWIDDTGAVDARVDDLGYIVTADNRKL